MNEAGTPIERTGWAQGRASDPTASAWVSANAGSGKTYVLSRRVIRLLLAGADPSRILCLTFTKAAAAEMARRVFGLLSEWTECDDDALRAALTELTGAAPAPAAMIRARRLFALALETPGGLKIQTIHAFCEALLQRFPLEANVPGHFRVLDEREQSVLIAEARAAVVAGAAHHVDPDFGAAFAVLIEDCSDHLIDRTLDEIIARRQVLHDWLESAGGLAPAIAELYRLHGVAPDDSPEQIDAEIGRSPHFSLVYVQRCMQVLVDGNKTDRETGARMTAFFECEGPAERARRWIAVFSTASGDWRKTDRMTTRACNDLLPDFAERAALEVARLEALSERHRALAAIRVTGAFVTVGAAVIARYDRAKTRRGLLDFEDLIVRSLNLLSKADAAPWVQYKLDQGIDHILVDEAQDTSPRQWSIVRALADEFFAGEGARAGTRTVFAVGDVKQSIYSFQGAEPRYFGQMRSHFAGRARDAARTFHPIALRLSFRSTEDVLSAVDAVFADAATADGVSSADEPILHDAIRAGEAGEVAVWPLFSDMAVPEPDDWSQPLDVESPQSARIRLAERIADQIAQWLATGAALAGNGRAMTPGDILILVRKRDSFVAALVRALKTRDIAVAGSDRLVLTDHIAIKDLIALGRVMVLRDDDLSLAAVLKGPLFGFEEADLLAIAHDRPGSLWDSLDLAASRDGNPTARRARDRLRQWMAIADFERPYEFFARILERDGGRQLFRARFGGEVDDVLDQFLLLALDTEDGTPPSLDRFLWNLEMSTLEIKRELDAARDDIRIMTVHGAKGLEAPVVFLVDPGSAPRHASHDPVIMELDRPHGADIPALSVTRTGAGIPAVVAARLKAHRQAGEQEYRRLLYVALTRARDRLVVCGYQGARGASEQCWHKLVWRALAPEAEELPFGEGDQTMLRWGSSVPDDRPAPNTGAEPTEGTEGLPEWAGRPAVAHQPIPRLAPSQAALGPEDADVPDIPPRDLFAEALEPDSTVLVRGRLVHRLLEVLPDTEPAERRDRAMGATSRALPGLDPAAHGRLVDDILALIDDPRFGEVFSAPGRAEVALSGFIETGDGRRHLVNGQIDRLVVTANRILIVDYKTNRNPPSEVAATPPQYIAQLALYRALLSSIYPGYGIEAALVWTSGPMLMPVPAEVMDDAMAQLQRAP